jgi:ferric-dicitrate binding protein FerR (iron transport regulator)
MPDEPRLAILHRRALLMGATASALGLSHADTAGAAQSVGRVGAIQGSAFLNRNGNRLDALDGMEILLHDIAVTGDQPSRADLLLGAATRIRLGANASFEINEFMAGKAATTTLTTGPALIERANGAERNFKLKSPFALLAARGTAFFAGPSKGVFGVFVREGVVVVRTRRGSVTLNPGEGTDIAAPGAGPTPVKAWGQTRIDEALASVN